MTLQLSVWLAPGPDQDRVLRHRIADIAARTGRPAFAPHLTVLGDLDVARDRLSAILGEIRAALPVQELCVAEIGARSLFFQSLYLGFPQSEVLRRFREGLTNRLGLRAPPFSPHLSMAYGRLGEGEQAEIGLLSDLLGTVLRFERLQMVHSNQSLAPAAWRVLEEYPLPGC